MTKTEFEELIKDNEHKEDILRLVDEGCTLLVNKDKSSLERYYEDCADLYNKSIGYYPNFKLNMANRIDILRYTHKSSCHQYTESQNRLKLVQDIDGWVHSYVIGNEHGMKYNDEQFVGDVVKVMYKHERIRNDFTKRLMELEDKLSILRIIKEFQGDNFPVEVDFLYKNGSNHPKLRISSSKALELFLNDFVPYFENRFLEGIRLDELASTIRKFRNATKKTLPHRAVYDLYMVFVKHGYIDFTTKSTDTYELGNKNGKFAALKVSVSLWIYHLLLSFRYISANDKKRGEEEAGYIKDCLKDKRCREIDLDKIESFDTIL